MKTIIQLKFSGHNQYHYWSGSVTGLTAPCGHIGRYDPIPDADFTHDRTRASIFHSKRAAKAAYSNARQRSGWPASVIEYGFVSI